MYSIFKSRRNGIPRDFTLLRNLLPTGSKVYINKFGNKHEAIFTGDGFKNEEEIFTSPTAFSKYVTHQYNTDVQHPSGWDVIHTIYMLDDGTCQLLSIKDIYDYEMKETFKQKTY